MKKLMVLAAGLLQIPVIKKAQEKGYYVIAVDDDPEAPGMALADKAIVPGGMTDEERMLTIARKEGIDGVIHPCSEVAMSVMGRINDELGLHGISRETARRATNKHLMREAFEAGGAPSPLSFCTDDATEGYRLYQRIGGKAILKPSRNSGSRGIAEVEPELAFADLEPLFARSKAESRDASVMIEQFVEGPEFSVEIIVCKGEVHALQVTDKKTTEAPNFVELGHSQPSQYAAEVVEAVRDAAVRGVKALRLNDCAAHAEVKVQDGRAYLMEIGARLGGDFISTELTHLSTGIDMVGAAVDVALGVEPDLAPKEQGKGVCIRYFTPEPGEVKEVKLKELQAQPNIYDAKIYVKPGDMIKDVQSSLDRSGHVIVIGDDVQNAINKAEQIVGGGYFYHHKAHDNRQMKLLIIGASILQLPAILKAKELGYYTIVTDLNPNAVGIPYADKFYPVNTIDVEGTAALAEKVRPDGIMTLATDLPMRSLAEATSRIGLPGISYETAVKATDKGEMIKAFEAAGVEHPWYFIVKSKEELAEVLPKINYPCVIKPTDNAGNRGVSFACSEEELLSLYGYSHENSHSGDVIIEEYMEGKEVSVEMIVCHGEVHILAVTDKQTQGKPYFVEIGHSEQSQLGEENVAKIKDLATRAVKAIGIDNSPAHVEIMLTKNGPKMVELGARMGGGCITTHLVPLSTGIDMIKSVMDLAMGMEPDVTPKFDKGSALRHIVGVEGEIVSIEGLVAARAVPGVTEVTMLQDIGDRVGYFKNGADRIGYVIAQGEDAADAVRICEEALKLIDIKTK